MAMIFFIFSLIIIFCGLFFATGKGFELVKKNMATVDANGSRFNEEEVLKYAGKIAVSFGIGVFMIGLGELVNRTFSILALIFLVAITFFGIIYLLTDPRFQK